MKHGPTSIDAWIGSRIRARREHIGLSQAKLGDALNVSFQQIQKYETGRNRVAASKIALLAKALDVPNTFFFMTGDTSDAHEEDVMMEHMLKDHQSRKLLMIFREIEDERTREAVVSIMRAVVEAFGDGARGRREP